MHYHLTQHQRIELSLLLRLGYSQRNTALVLGVNPSTICRELQRNNKLSGKYHATHAGFVARNRRSAANSLRIKLLVCPELARLVSEKLQADLAPEQIAGWLRASHKLIYVCAQTIYDWVYVYARHLLKHLHCRKGKQD